MQPPPLEQASDSATVGQIPELTKVATDPVDCVCLSGAKVLFGRSARHRHGDCINESDKNALEEPASLPATFKAGKFPCKAVKP
jgi:hypothetical protein